MLRDTHVSVHARPLRAFVAIAVAGALTGASVAGAASAKSFRKAADKICAQAARELTEYELENPFEDTPQWAVDRGAFYIDLYEGVVTKLEKLDPPKKLRPTFGEYIEAVEARISLEQQSVDAAEQEDQAAAQALGPEYEESLDTRRELGTDLGLFACAQRLSKREEKKVRDTVEETWLNGDPAFCTEKYTESWVQFIGGVEECEAGERDPANAPDSIEIHEVYGVDKAFASAEFTVTGPRAPSGEDLRQDMLYEDGVYKRDNVQQSQATS